MTGDTSSRMVFNIAMKNINHTVCNLCKYRSFNNASHERISTSTSTTNYTNNRVFGFVNQFGNQGLSGQGMQVIAADDPNGWSTDNTINHFYDEWVLSSQQCIYIVGIFKI